MRSSPGPFRRIVDSLRHRGNETDKGPKTQDTFRRTSDDTSDTSIYPDLERKEVLGKQDPLLPDLLAAVKDYQLTHGSLIKLTWHPATSRLPIAHTVLAQPIGVSIVPTVWPEERFHEAWNLQPILQELYAQVSSDPDYLWNVIKDCVAADDDAWSDEIMSGLWKVYESVREDADGLGQVQDTEIGLCRGDWMLDIESQSETRDATLTNSDGDRPKLPTRPGLKQVELNTIATAGISHSNIVSKMHIHLLKTEIYSQMPSLARRTSTVFTPLPAIPPFPKLAPDNNGIQAFAQALAQAHTLYGRSRSSATYRTAVLMVVQHNNVNIADERPLEYALWKMDPPVPCFRCEYREVMSKTWFAAAPTTRDLAWQKDQTGRELIYKPYPGDCTPFEISVVYHRGSLSADELSSSPYPNSDPPHAGLEIRNHLERSRAIKCPSVLGQLAASKKVQQHLSSNPGAMERFIGRERAQKLRDRCMPMHSLADASNPLRQVLDECIPPPNTKASPQTVRTALQSAEKALAPYVLKPIGAEGGGHCVFGKDIPGFYAEVIAPAKSQNGYILMQRIHPPVVCGALISQQGYHVGPVVSELGILGTCIWKREKGDQSKFEEGSSKEEKVERKREEIETLNNESVGWTLKSKSEDVPEMSVIKGYGCFDTPCLVSWDWYEAEARVGVKDWE